MRRSEKSDPNLRPKRALAGPSTRPRIVHDAPSRGHPLTAQRQRAASQNQSLGSTAFGRLTRELIECRGMNGKWVEADDVTARKKIALSPV
jgi:hypothetical protein